MSFWTGTEACRNSDEKQNGQRSKQTFKFQHYFLALLLIYFASD